MDFNSDEVLPEYCDSGPNMSHFEFLSSPANTVEKELKQKDSKRVIVYLTNLVLG